ncbi:MAG: phosphoglycerol transferase MdoB-like AlkP superfamily enzyme [Marivirga sp.]|jgi:phosphoglycerol transferase MdoB-like AlkP superfamily enzyme
MEAIQLSYFNKPQFSLVLPVQIIISQSMLRRVLFLLLFYVSLMLYFSYFRAVFLLYQIAAIDAEISWDMLQTFIHGLPLDASFSAYLTAIPVALLSFTTLFSSQLIKTTFKIYIYTVLTVMTVLQVVDLELYRNWGFRIDNSFFKYLNTPKEIWASSGAAPLGLLLVLFTITISIAIYFFSRFTDYYFRRFQSLQYYWFLLFIFLLAVLIIPIRGGFQLAPINQSVAYFSSTNLLNQAALNAPWNLSQSLVDASKPTVNPFHQMENDIAKKLVNPYYEKTQDSTLARFDSVFQKPMNIVVIVWESFTAKVVKALGGLENVTPNFNKLTQQGLLIDGMYASATRSDKGLVAILSGYPSQANQSIMNLPSKTLTIPSLAREFNKNGYETNFYYGGELAFANLKSYLINTGYQNIIGKTAFDAKDMNSKWGAHDDVLFNKVLLDLKSREKKKPHFTTIFTLSSHEPFEVPMKTVIQGADESSLFLNSLYYTDKAIGRFISELEQLGLTENTIIIITADHGHRLPFNTAIESPESYKIPFLWLGPVGAYGFVKDSVRQQICSQTDIASTLLSTLNINDTDFHWSRNIFKNQKAEFSISTMKTGFIWTDHLGSFSYDYKGRKIIYNTHNQIDSTLVIGQAHLQLSFQDFLNK